MGVRDAAPGFSRFSRTWSPATSAIKPPCSRCSCWATTWTPSIASSVRAKASRREHLNLGALCQVGHSCTRSQQPHRLPEMDGFSVGLRGVGLAGGRHGRQRPAAAHAPADGIHRQCGHAAGRRAGGRAAQAAQPRPRVRCAAAAAGGPPPQHVPLAAAPSHRSNPIQSKAVPPRRAKLLAAWEPLPAAREPPAPALPTQCATP